MKDKELLLAVRSIDRNLMTLVNVSLTGILGKMAQEAKETDDEEGKKIAKTGLMMIAFAQAFITVSHLCDLVKALKSVKKEKKHSDLQQEA